MAKPSYEMKALRLSSEVTQMKNRIAKVDAMSLTEERVLRDLYKSSLALNATLRYLFMMCENTLDDRIDNQRTR